MSPLSVKDAKAYAGNFPKFSQPTEIACFSRDAGRRISFDRSSLRPYRVPRLPAALDEGFESYVPRNSEGEEAPLGPILDALVRQNIKPAAGSFITYRNNLNKIFATPYSPRDDWEVDVERREDGVILLGVRDTDRKKAEEANRDERQQRMSYWGYRFEQLATLTDAEAAAHASTIGSAASSGNPASDKYRVPSPSDVGSFDHLYPPDELATLRERYSEPFASEAPQKPAAAAGQALPPVNANEEFCSIVQLSIEKVKLLMAAEIDCVADKAPSGAAASAPGAPVAKGYVELKTSKIMSSQRDTENFERHKLLKFWLQSFLAGVPSVIVGFRDEGGQVRELKTYETKTIHRLVRGKARDGGNHWDPTVCFNFGKAVLEWLLGEVGSGGAAKYVMRYDPQQQAVKLQKEGAAAAASTGEDGPPDAKRQRHSEFE